MHCSLEFLVIGLPIAIHSQWDEEQTSCTLRIFTSRQEANDFLVKLHGEERRDFEECMGVLRDGADEPGLVTIEGDIGLSLTRDLVVLLCDIQIVDFPAHAAGEPDLMGFWAPILGRPSSSGLVMWFDPRDGYHVVIPQSQEQVRQVIGTLSWLKPRRRQRLLAQLSRWNSPAQSSEVMREIKGVVAELLCRASVAMKIRQALERQEKAILN